MRALDRGLAAQRGWGAQDERHSDEGSTNHASGALSKLASCPTVEAAAVRWPSPSPVLVRWCTAPCPLPRFPAFTKPIGAHKRCSAGGQRAHAWLDGARCAGRPAAAAGRAGLTLHQESAGLGGRHHIQHLRVWHPVAASFNHAPAAGISPVRCPMALMVCRSSTVAHLCCLSNLNVCVHAVLASLPQLTPRAGRQRTNAPHGPPPNCLPCPQTP